MSKSSDTAGVNPALEGASLALAQFTSELTLERIPDDVVNHVRYLILDALGCCIQGSGLPWTRHVARLVLDEGSNGKAHLFGSGESVSPAQAVLVNATAGHAFEMDDIHRDSIIHGGSIVVPVALALGESHGDMSGKRFLESVVAGYEVGTRVGSGASQSLLLNGFHPQGTTGALAAGAAAAKALELNSEQTLHALGTAASQGAGLMAAQEGAMVKRFHSGRAAQSGVYSALLARNGFTGITDFVEAPYGGFLSAFSSDPQPERVLNGLGTSHWETAQVGYKPFAAVTSIHTCLEALQLIMSTHDLAADDIERVDAYISKPTWLHCAWPYTGQSVTAAQMNLYYGMAVMALDGAAFVDQYREDRLLDPAITDFISRVHAIDDDEINALGPSHRHTARVIVTSKNAQRFEQRVEKRKGSPDNPLTTDEVVAKFYANATTRQSRPLAEQLHDTVLNVESLNDVTPLVELMICGNR